MANPGDGYRLLKHGEIVEATDEVFGWGSGIKDASGQLIETWYLKPLEKNMYIGIPFSADMNPRRRKLASNILDGF